MKKKLIDKDTEQLLNEIQRLQKENDDLKLAVQKDISKQMKRADKSELLNTSDQNEAKLLPDEKTIRQLFEDYIRMYAGRDDLLTTYFSDNFSGFTGGGDFLVKDKNEWIAITRQDFEQVKESIRIEMKDLSIQALTDNIAVTTGFFKIHLPIKDHILSRETARLVLIFRKESNGWKIAHSSISIPYYLVRDGEVYPMKELVDRNQFLEKLVAERTNQLLEVNEKLQKTNEELCEEIIKHTKAEEALQKSKQQYDNLVSQIPVGIYQMRCNPEGNLKLDFISTRAAKMFNAGVEDLLADFQIAFRSIHPDDLSLLNKLNQDGIKHHKPFDWKGRLKLDGTVKWLHINSTPEALDNGDVLWHGLVVDITERMQAEEAMKKSEQKYRLLVDKANEAIVVVQNGFLQLSNPMTLTMTGYSAEEIGVTPFHLFIHPEDREWVVGNYQKRLMGENVPSYYIFRLLSKDGSTRWVYMSGAQIEWEGSAATLNFLTDITELRLAEEALQKSSQKWEALIAVSPDGIGMISLDGKMLLMSDKLAEMYGYTMKEKDEIIGKPAFDFIDPVDHKRLAENMIKLIAGERENQLSEYLAIRKDKSRFKIDINTTLLLDSNGKPSSILFVERDITERKNAEEEIIQKNLELAELNATKDKFFSIIAHDLKSPFQGLISYAQILSTQFSVLSEEEKISFIGGIETLSQSSYRLLENLLEWSRLQTGQMIYMPESINLLVELYPTISLVKQTALNKKIEFTYSIDNSIVVMADTNMLSTIIRNLVSNSIKFTNPGGKIILAANKLNGFIEFSVSDTGIGIEKESLEKLFTIGNNESRKGTANEGGTGLGLLLCKEMIAKHGGEIRLKSEVNKGTTFSFTIPT